MSTKIISTLNYKGGVGKTTTTLNVAHALALRGARVLLLNCDMQSDGHSLLKSDYAPRRLPDEHMSLTHVLLGQATLAQVIYEARENLWIVPSDTALIDASNYIVAQGRKGYARLKNQLALVQSNYDYILCDLAPNFNAVSESALLASDSMLIPCELSPFAIENLVAMFGHLGETLQGHELTLIGIIPYGFDGRLSMHKAYESELLAQFPGQVLPSVRTDSSVPKSQSMNVSIFEYVRDMHVRSVAADDFLAIAGVVAGDAMPEQARAAVEEARVLAAAAAAAKKTAGE